MNHPRTESVPRASFRRLAIVGAGPVGIEAALRGVAAGYDVQVYESGRIAESVLRWGFLRLFSPWHRNVSSLGTSRLGARGQELLASADYPTGREWVRDYLRPLSRLPELDGRIHEHTRVVSIGRENLLKGERIGGDRGGTPFRLLVADPARERIEHADIVLDASGTYATHLWMGPGNVPALGERALQDRIDYALVDIDGDERDRFVGRRVLLVGAGHSAATALDRLRKLPGTSVEWILREAGGDPLPPIPDDPLPERARLSRLANAIAHGTEPSVRVRAGATVEAIRAEGRGFRVRCGGRHPADLEVDRVLALVGYAPDSSIHRELQVHLCWATEGPMALAAALLGATSADCLTRPVPDGDTLVLQEPGFHLLGAKSYGRHPGFLAQHGYAQVERVFAHLADRGRAAGCAAPTTRDA